MTRLLPTLLCAGTAAAQLTTSVWLPIQNLGYTDKVGLVGSVVAASGATFTASVQMDNGTSEELIIITDMTLTFGPSMFAYENTRQFSRYSSFSGGGVVKYTYTIPPSPTDAQPVATVSYPPAPAKRLLCQDPIGYTTTQFQTVINSYPARLSYSAGVETVTRAQTISPASSTPKPTWCDDDSYFPPTGWVYSVTKKKEDFAYYQLVLTAGVEKLSAASATATKSGTGTNSQNKAAAPMKTVGPVLAGMGAAMAIFL